MQKTTYLLTAVSAFALGAGTASVGDFTARAGKPVKHIEEVTTTDARAAFAARTQLQTINGICDIAEDQLGLDAGSCTISDVRGWCVRTSDADGVALDPVQISAVVLRDMTLVDGSPE